MAGLWTLVLLAYANALGGVFQFDDYNVIVDLDTVHNFSAWWMDSGQGIRPLLKLSYLLNWTSGLGAPGFHAVNILLHGLTVWLVFVMAQRLLLAWQRKSQITLTAWCAAALFALHPANTEAVAYVCGRSVSLMALCYLAGVWAHATCTHRPAWRRWLAPLFFGLALCVKETAVTFPLALLLWDMACGDRPRDALQKARWSWLVLLLAACVFGVNDAYRSAMLRSLEFNSLAGNVATQLSALVYLARQWALPLWLNIDPDLAVQHDFSQALPGFALLLVAIWLAVRTWRQRPWIGFALGWAVLHWLPLYLVLPRLDVANDRQLYLAIWPLGLAVTVELLRLPPRLAFSAIGALLLAYALLTVQRNQDYRSEIALWEQTVALSPHKSRVHNNLGYAYKEAGRPVEARREYLRALQLDAGNTKARLNLRRLNAEQAAKAAP